MPTGRLLKTSATTQSYIDLGRLAKGPLTPDGLREIKRGLRAKSGLVVSAAAGAALAHDLRDLVPEMVAAFARLSKDGSTVDKGCRGKTAIVKALNLLDSDDASVFVAGADYVQMEPSFGPPEDTAVDIRCECASTLARTNHSQAHYILADLLVDKEKKVRIAAVQALIYLAEPEDELMLRLKVLVDDDEAEVRGGCLEGLMAMAPKRSLEFVARYVSGLDRALFEYAAIALGTSHLPEALEVLKNTWRGALGSEVREALLLPIALIRSDDAFDFLVDVVKKGESKLGARAIPALKLYAADKYATAVRAAVDARDDKAIWKAFEQES